MSTPSSFPGPPSSTCLLTQLSSSLAKKSLQPSEAWLSSFLATQRPSTPLPALLSTAAFRLLASDITKTFKATNSQILPAGVTDASTRERLLPPEDIVVQILDVEDMSRSRWEQIETLEALERGEGTKGKQIVRLQAADQDEQVHGSATNVSVNNSTISTAAAAAIRGGGPHKVLLQDARGVLVYGIEVMPVKGLGLDMNVGAKLVLRRCTVARGVVLLEPSSVIWLGGKIDSLHKSWVQGKKARLTALIAGDH